MIKYTLNYKRILLVLIVIILCNFSVWNLYDKQSIDFFRIAILFGKYDDIALFCIIAIIWIVPYIVFYVYTMKEFETIFDECKIYFLLHNQSIKKIYYYMFVKLFIEMLLINIGALLFLYFLGQSISVMQFLSNIVRMSLFLSILLGISLVGYHRDNMIFIFYTTLLVGTVMSVLNNFQNIIGLFFINRVSSIYNCLIIVLIIICIQTITIHVSKKID